MGLFYSEINKQGKKNFQTKNKNEMKRSHKNFMAFLLVKSLFYKTLFSTNYIE